MAIELVERYLPYVDEQFSTESKKELLTNNDFTFEGAHSVKIYRISTGSMNDYGRSGPKEQAWSRYGKVEKKRKWVCGPWWMSCQLIRLRYSECGSSITQPSRRRERRLEQP